MATCPNCGGFLDDRHRCAGVWRLRLRLLFRIAVWGGIGGSLGGWLILFVFFRQVSWVAVAIAAVLGMIVMAATQLGESTGPYVPPL